MHAQTKEVNKSESGGMTTVCSCISFKNTGTFIVETLCSSHSQMLWFKFQLLPRTEGLYIYTTIIIHSLVFSLIGRAGRNQSPVI